MTSNPDGDLPQTVHHWYEKESDLLPYCGEIPGPDAEGIWHTGHTRDILLAWSRGGAVCCGTCINLMTRSHSAY